MSEPNLTPLAMATVPELAAELRDRSDICLVALLVKPEDASGGRMMYITTRGGDFAVRGLVEDVRQGLMEQPSQFGNIIRNGKPED